MPHRFALCACLLSATTLSLAQQSTPSPASSPSAPAKIYSLGHGVKAPELLPSEPPATPVSGCKPKFIAREVVHLIVDAEGHPRSIEMFRDVGMGLGLDQDALQVAAADRFRPGIFQGKPVPVWIQLTVNVPICVTTAPQSGPARQQALAGITQELGSIPWPPNTAVLTPVDDSIKHN